VYANSLKYFLLYLLIGNERTTLRMLAMTTHRTHTSGSMSIWVC